MTNQTTSSRALRIRSWYLKLAYVIAAVALVYVAPVIPVGPSGAGILRSALAFVLILVGARLFRGAGEEIAPPRPWWRMTAAVPSSILLGSLFTLVAVFSAAGYVGITASTLPHKDTIDLAALLVNAALSAVLAYLYLQCSRKIVVARREEAIANARAGRPTSPSRPT